MPRDTLDRIAEHGVIAVMRGVPSDRAVGTARALARGGVGAVELTADAPGAVDALGAVRAELDTDEALAGGGQGNAAPEIQGAGPFDRCSIERQATDLGTV